jgi:hypothetical protein
MTYVKDSPPTPAEAAIQPNSPGEVDPFV